MKKSLRHRVKSSACKMCSFKNLAAALNVELAYNDEAERIAKLKGTLETVTA